jgi:septal ring factor EnvC (AmiA/AmiB activator)
MLDLSAIIVPIVVSVILSVSGALVVSKRTGTAQEAYVKALEGRLKVVTDERSEAWAHIPKLEARILALEEQVEALTRQGIAKDRELARLYRRLDADELRLVHDEHKLERNHDA